MNQGTFGCFCQDHRKTSWPRWSRRLLLIDSKKKLPELTNIFSEYFFTCTYFREIRILCIFGVYWFSRMSLKIKFHVHVILPKFAKVSTLKIDTVAARKLWKSVLNFFVLNWDTGFGRKTISSHTNIYNWWFKLNFFLKKHQFGSVASKF